MNEVIKRLDMIIQLLAKLNEPLTEVIEECDECKARNVIDLDTPKFPIDELYERFGVRPVD